MTSLIFPGDEILVQPADSAPTTPEPTKTIKLPGPTVSKETPLAIGSAVSFAAIGTPTKITSPPSTIEMIPNPEEELENPSVQWIIILAFVVIFLVIVGSLFFQKNPERPSDDDVVR